MPQPLCSHFGICGGCASQHMSYSEQLKQKEAAIAAILAPFYRGEIQPIIPSPVTTYYRNKMEFAFGLDDNKQFALGLRKRGSFFRVVDLTDCALLSRDSNVILQLTREWAKNKKIPPYFPKTHQGVLRYLVIREGKNTGNIMVNLISTPALERTHVMDLMHTLLYRFPALTTFLWSQNAGVSDICAAESMEVLHGSGFIEDTIHDITFKISPFSFFQTNTYATANLYTEIKKLVVAHRTKGSAVLDLYCGGGGIALSIAREAERVIGMESNKAAVEDAVENAARNHIANASFLCGEVEKELAAHIEAFKSSALGIIDPPRSGLHPKALKHILELGLPAIIYVSCNPKVLAHELNVITKNYDILYAQPLDLFPYTPHQETILLLHKRA